MNQATEKKLNGNVRSDQPTPDLGTIPEESQAPSTEVKKPFVAEKKKATGGDNWKAIAAGIAIIAVILVAALTHKSGVKTSASLQSSQQQSPKNQQTKGSAYGSTTPVNTIATNSDLPADGTRIGPGAIAHTAKPHATATTTANNLGEVPAFNPPAWQPAPYPGTASGGVTQQQEDKSERDALDKASLVFVRTSSSSKTQEATVHETGEVDVGLGLPTGTRLRAHLTSAVGTAVKTPVVAVIEYNYEQDGEILIPAGAKAIGHLESADRSGYIGIRFDTLQMPNGTTVRIEAVATDLRLRPLKGKVEGKNTGKNLLVRSLSGIGEVMATLVGQGNLNQPLSEADLLRGRVASNIGQASDEEVERLSISEHVVVSMPANTAVYVVLAKETKARAAAPEPARPTAGNHSTTAEQLQQLMQLQRELNQNLPAAGPNQ